MVPFLRHHGYGVFLPYSGRPRTRREQLERLLTDIDTKTGPAASQGGFAPIEYNTPELRKELGLD